MSNVFIAQQTRLIAQHILLFWINVIRGLVHVVITETASRQTFNNLNLHTLKQDLSVKHYTPSGNKV